MMECTIVCSYTGYTMGLLFVVLSIDLIPKHYTVITTAIIAITI